MKKLNSILATAILLSAILISCGEKNKDASNESKDSTEKSEKADDISKEEISEKKNTLIKLKGDHKLNSISGFMGANTIVDYIIENGKWTASGSSNMGGMREGYDIELTKDDLKKLKSFIMK